MDVDVMPLYPFSQWDVKAENNNIFYSLKLYLEKDQNSSFSPH
jgi:hypothetical protein